MLRAKIIRNFFVKSGNSRIFTCIGCTREKKYNSIPLPLLKRVKMVTVRKYPISNLINYVVLSYKKKLFCPCSILLLFVSVPIISWKSAYLKRFKKEFYHNISKFGVLNGLQNHISHLIGLVHMHLWFY